jgi:Ricin-type beta-trefoil lectin domain
MRWAGRAALAGTLLGLGLAGPGLAASPAQAATAQAATARGAAASPPARSSLALPAGVKRACPAPRAPGIASCDSLLVSTATAGQAHLGVQAATAPAGYSPANLQSAYGLQSESEGTRQTVAVVVPYDDPTAEADLGIYRSQYALPPCTTANGCFTKADLSSSPTENAGWAQEAQIDLDVVSAVCPNCHILLVEAPAADLPDLGSAVQTAVADGAHVVDFTPNTPEFSGETSDDSYFDQPGVAIVTPSGDSGYGVSYPAASPYVTAVGGTVLTGDSSVARGWTETVWSGTGSGCSAYEPQPSWQASLNSGCTGRMDNDVSAVAASASSPTPVAYYDSYDTDGWGEAGGTVVSASVIAGVYALAGTPAAGSTPASYPYSHPDLLNAVTSGSNGTCSVTSWCTGGTGYNGPAGKGTPKAVIPFTSTGTVSGAIYNGSVGKCMDNANNSTTNGNKVQIWTCIGDAAQNWTWEADGRIESGNGMCVGIKGSTSAPAGSDIWVWNCGSGGVVWLPNYQQRLNDGVLNMCMGLTSSGDGANGTQLWINGCDTDGAQQWTMPYPVPTSTGEIQPQASSAVCIGLNTSSSTGAATLFGCDGDSNQTWTIEANGTIKAGSGDCLDVHDSGTSAGTEIDYAGCNSMASQQWRVEANGSLLNPESNLCIEPSGGAATAGTALVLESCSYTTIQEWTLPALPS